MIKRSLLICIMVIALLISCACGVKDIKPEDIALSKMVSSEDGTITLSVPEDWEKKETLENDSLFLTLSDNVSAYVQVYRYAFDEFYDSMDAFLEEYRDYYGEDILGEVESLNIGGNPARKFEYLYEDYNEHFYEARFRGFVYLIEIPDGIICIDAYHSITEPFSETDEVSTEGQRALLVRIIETIKITEAADESADMPAEPTPDAQETEQAVSPDAQESAAPAA